MVRPSACGFCGSPGAGERCVVCGAEPGPVPAPEPTKGARPDVRARVRPDGLFGLVAAGGRRLTFSPDGTTNSTLVKPAGKRARPLAQLTPILRCARRRGAWTGAWATESGPAAVRLTQRIELVTGPTTQTRDTLRVEWQLWNPGRRPRALGLRVMIDTLIGMNDGVPFLAAGRQGLVSRSIELIGAAVPGWVQALERPDPLEPGTIVHLTLRGAGATPPDRLVIDRWPGAERDRWEMFRGPGRSWSDGYPDSAIACYWDPIALEPGQSRRLSFLYGLGGISSQTTGNTELSLVAPRRVERGERFPVSVRVFAPGSARAITLELPPGLACDPATPARQPLEGEADAVYALAGWDVLALEPGLELPLRVQLEGGASEATTVTVGAGAGVTRPS